MRMSHLYQPLMVKTLIDKGGWASLTEIPSSWRMMRARVDRNESEEDARPIAKARH